MNWKKGGYLPKFFVRTNYANLNVFTRDLSFKPTKDAWRNVTWCYLTLKKLELFYFIKRWFMQWHTSLSNHTKCMWQVISVDQALIYSINMSRNKWTIQFQTLRLESIYFDSLAVKQAQPHIMSRTHRVGYKILFLNSIQFRTRISVCWCELYFFPFKTTISPKCYNVLSR